MSRRPWILMLGAGGMLACVEYVRKPRRKGERWSDWWARRWYGRTARNNAVIDSKDWPEAASGACETNDEQTHFGERAA